MSRNPRCLNLCLGKRLPVNTKTRFLFRTKKTNEALENLTRQQSLTNVIVSCGILGTVAFGLL